MRVIEKVKRRRKDGVARIVKTKTNPSPFGSEDFGFSSLTFDSDSRYSWRVGGLRRGRVYTETTFYRRSSNTQLGSLHQPCSRGALCALYHQMADIQEHLWW